MRRLVPYAPVIAGAIGLWLGVEAIRSFFTIIVWNVAEDLPSTQLGLVGAAFWIIGLLGWAPARLLGRLEVRGAMPGPELTLGVFFGVLTVLRQAVQDEAGTAILAIAALIAWLWWLPAWLHATVRAGHARQVVPALLLGMAAQSAGQVALDGLDLHALPGLPSALAALVLGAGFVWGLGASRGVPSDAAGPVGRWGAFAILPWLFLQLTLFANIGRLESLGNWYVPLSGLVAAAGYLLAALATAGGRRFPGASRAVTAALLVVTAAMVVAAAAGGLATLLLIPAQGGLALILDGGLASPTGRQTTDGDQPGVATPGAQPRTWLAAGLGGVLFFAFLFTLYSTALDNLGTQVWPAAIVVVALPGLLRSRAARMGRATGPARLEARDLRPAAAIVAVAIAGSILGALPARAERPTLSAAPARLVVLNYNIHQGFSRTGYPNLERTAVFLRDQNADLITLQEVPRTWDLSGAVDTFSWLAERLPEYHAIYGPTSMARFGNAILSRHVMKAAGFEWFAFGPSRDQRGFAWAELDTTAGTILLVTMHMTPYNRGEEVQERDGQARQMLEFWAARGKPLGIFSGDYNSQRDDPAYQRLLAGGLVDATALALPGLPVTFRSTGTPFLPGGTETIDFVLVSPAIKVAAASIPETDISDHYPQLVTLGLGGRQ